ncbi:MAG: hypothetical protein ABW215_11975, partial [Kibdelosporangium sp.]
AADCPDIQPDLEALVLYGTGFRRHCPRGDGTAFEIVGEPRGGAAFLSIRSGVPVVPVHLDGTGAILGRGMKRPKPGRTKVTFGAPLTPREGEDARRFGERIEAAVAVLGEQGLARLTHRAAAGEAGVPLGSTTYYFADLDELLAAALRTVAGRNVERLRQWARALPDRAVLSVELADFLVLLATEHRQTSVLAYELYGAALRRPALRPASTAWDAMLTEVFESRVDSVTARALTVMFDGLLYQALVSPETPRRAHFEPVLRRLLDR